MCPDFVFLLHYDSDIGGNIYHLIIHNPVARRRTESTLHELSRVRTAADICILLDHISCNSEERRRAQVGKVIYIKGKIRIRSKTCWVMPGPENEDQVQGSEFSFPHSMSR